MNYKRLLFSLITLSLMNTASSKEENNKAASIPVDYFSVPDDLEVTVWAEGNLLRNPIAMDMDHKGKMWLTEGVNYRRMQGRDPKGDRIMVLQDTNNDGKADKSHVFVQDPELVSPLGLAVFGNRILLSQPPHLIMYTDLNKNMVFDKDVDKKEILLTGFNGKNHDHSLHSVTAGPDGKWYINQGNCGALVTDKSGKTVRVGSSYRGGGNVNVENAGKKSDDGHVWVGGFIARMNPDGTDLEVIGHNMRNSHEHTVNSYGEVFQSDNDDPPACRNSHVLEYGSAGFFSHNGKQTWETDRRPGQDIPTAHWRQEDPGFMPAGDVYGSGSPTGVAYYENGALPEKYNGMYLAAEAKQRVIFKYFPKITGAGFELKRDYLLKAANKPRAYMFRPSDVEVGADGAIYISDWYDQRVGGHGTQDATMSGTIYRIAPKNWKRPHVNYGTETLEDYSKLLKSPSDNLRYLGFEGFKKNGSKSLPYLKNILKNKNSLIAARAIWLLPHAGQEGRKICLKLLKSKDQMTRLTAYKALRRTEKDILPYAKMMHNDPSAIVRREVALSLRDTLFEKKSAIIKVIYDTWDGQDKAYLEAIGLSLPHSSAQFWTLNKPSVPADKWSEKFVKLTWRLHPEEAIPSLIERALNPKASEQQRKYAIDTIAFTPGSKAPNSLIKLYDQTATEKAYVKMWFNLNIDGNKWDGLVDRNLVASKFGIVKPGAPMPYEQPEAPKTRKMPKISEIVALKGDSNKGKNIAVRCIMCHKIEGNGVLFGPSLNGWAKGRSSQEILNAIINPDADIAHGFTSSRVKLKNGKVIDGLIKSGAERARHFVASGGAEPHMVIKTAGGTTQKISWRHIKEVQKLERSLMFYPESLGLTQAQDFVDLAEYLKTLK